MLEYHNQFIDSLQRLASEELASPNYIIPTLEEAPADTIPADSLSHALEAPADTAKDALESLLDQIPFLGDTIASPIKSAVETGFIGKPLASEPSDNPLMVIMMLLAFFSFLYVVISRREYLKEIVKNFFFMKERLSIFIDSSTQSLSTFNVNVIYVFIASTAGIIYSLMSYTRYDSSVGGVAHELLPLMCAGIPILYLAVKTAGLHFLNYIFSGGEMYIKTYFTLLYVMGLAMYPISLVLIFAPMELFWPALTLSCVVLGIYTLMLIYKILQIFMRDLISLLYIILYLCTFEILGLLMTLKIVLGW